MRYVIILLKIFSLSISFGVVIALFIQLSSFVMRITKPTIVCEIEKNLSENEVAELGKTYVSKDAELLREIGFSRSEDFLKALSHETACCGAELDWGNFPEHKGLWTAFVHTTKLDLNLEAIILIDKCGNYIKRLTIMTPKVR